LDAADLDGARLRSLVDIQSLPVISRAEVKRMDIEDLLALPLVSSRGSVAYTSGSTGEPLMFYRDARDILRRIVNTEEEFRYGLGSRVVDDEVVVLGLENHPDLSGFGRHFNFAQLESDDARRGELYPHVRAVRPVLVTATSALQRLLIHLLTRDRGMKLSFQAIFYRGERLEEPYRQRLSALFGCPLYATYGSAECSLLGIECSSHRLHTAPWMNYIEILRDDGSPASLGEEGDVVVTFLENYVMPFIRYRVGDRGSFDPEPCACGRASRLIRISGREQLMIRLPNRVLVPVLNLARYINERYSEAILQYQFIDAPDAISFRYVPTDPLNPGVSGMEQAIRGYFLEQLRNLREVRIEAVASLGVQKGGKTPLLIREPGDSPEGAGDNQVLPPV
jgi:phenylacetate-CoA ligase